SRCLKSLYSQSMMSSSTVNLFYNILNIIRFTENTPLTAIERKEKQLQSMYPCAHPGVLACLFASKGFDLHATLAVLRWRFGPPAHSVLTIDWVPDLNIMATLNGSRNNIGSKPMDDYYFEMKDLHDKRQEICTNDAIELVQKREEDVELLPQL
ncbi:hypothetical protein PENTCL1PPCAC_10193, partial [Pristionchus entomophagus]